MRVLATCLLACVLLTAPVPAAETWTFAASDHFEVYTTGGAKQARAALAYFERVHAFFADFLHLSPKQARPTRVIVFSGEREFKPYRPNEVAIAYYQPGPDRDYIVMQSFDPEGYPVVVHEYAHLIIRHSGDVFPLWLNEGLAEFFSTLATFGGKMTIGRVPLGELQQLSGTALMPVSRVLAVNHDSPEYNKSGHAGLFYAQSWALTHMLYTHDTYRTKTQSFLAAVSGGMSAEAAFQSIYGRTLAQVSGDLLTYVKGTTFRYFSADYRDPKPESAYEVRAVPAFESRLMTATLLAEGSATEAPARQALTTLAAEAPNDVGLLETRAYLELWHGHREEAAPFMAQAIQAGSRNARLYRDYATMAKSPEDEAPLLEKAVALDPDDIDIRLRYASALLRLRRAEATLSALDAIKTVPTTEAFMFFQLAANAFMQVGRVADAQASAAKAVSYAEPGAQETYAKQLAQGINDFATRSAAAEAMAKASTPTTAQGSASPTSTASGAQTTRGETPFADFVTIVIGRIRNLSCSATPVVMEVAANGRAVRLVIDDPMRIRVIAKDGHAADTDLTCGAQDTPVRLGYEPKADEASHTLGFIRLLDFSGR